MNDKNYSQYRKRVKIDDVVYTQTSGLTMKDLSDSTGDYPVYGASGLVKYIEEYKQDQDYLAIVKDGSGIGRVAKYPKCSSVLGTMQYLLPKEGENIDFLRLALQDIKLDRFKSGSSIPHIYFRDYKNEMIYTYPIEIQKLISKRIGAIETAISKKRMQMVLLDNLVKSRFIEMFGDPVTNSMHFPGLSLKDVCEKITDGTHHSPQSYSTGEYPYITAKNIKEDGIDLSSITYVTKEVHDEIYKRCDPKQNDLLYIKDGATTGIATVNRLSNPFSMLSSVALLRPNLSIVTPEYLSSYLNNPLVCKDIRSNMGGAAITRLTLAKIEKIRVVIPPLSLQYQYGEMKSKVDKSKFVVKFRSVHR